MAFLWDKYHRLNDAKSVITPSITVERGTMKLSFKDNNIDIALATYTIQWLVDRVVWVQVHSE